MAGFKFDVKKRKQGDLKEIKYESISISKTFNDGNYESTKIELRANVEKGESVESLARDIMEQIKVIRGNFLEE
ncbi:MAG: hypothetical protein WC180_07035 [Candidatus Paceibacterota bacterium]|jgi:hypothetical protein